MQIADERTHRLLAYVALATGAGYPLTLRELYAYDLRPQPEPRGLQAVVAALAVRPVNPESLVSWMVRAGWLTGRDDVVRLTDLGRIVLEHLNRRDIEAEAPIQVALSPDDPVAYARVIERIARRGQALLVDPYFRLDHLLHIVQHSSVTRLLTSRKGGDGEARASALAVALSRLNLERPFEVRISGEIHDRFVIPPSGPVDMLGTSLSGVGKALSVLIEIGEPAAGEIRRAHERIWGAATRLEEPPAAEEFEPPEAGGESAAPQGQAENVAEGPGSPA